ncbi:MULTISPECIES: FAD-binding and (Fe-S)-binding domain-containing protein [unclassified Haloferax]|uniref:FAD-binding and (Fe-S)-binding domain-containing protein n=1 Tax=unclassified Haloferax TaxID=2625095 RepID=UPI000E240627|nr:MULTISPECIES: FAD-binding and (Fe-S)-binding domain-containing protein [unclassified Haloferax]RDZ34339.1 FAD-binding oxidoreductase [Haloferax sp. Atlit-24N]RLM35957.1 FAD-binding oxidoreductase [Haloferax sp. Atlit-109R]RLM41838.1 FAD-binding oxidoreductase [Haloferax sp. Atlit-105R]
MATQERPDDPRGDRRADSQVDRRVDPSDDPRAGYDYAGGDTDREALVSDLDRLVDGDVRFDEYTRQLYATDASAYEVLPVGVVMPTSTADVAAVVEYCADREIPVLPRGGGTSLAGQAVNEAVVLDLSRHMDGVESVDSEAATATAQAGVTLAELNNSAADHGLTFGPDPAAGDRSVLGGAIGNNSTGAHSLKYGKTDYYVEECEVVLADGSVHQFGEVGVDDLREKADPDSDAWGADGPESPLLPRIYAEVVRVLDEEREEIDARYPDLKRNVSGYNLDALVDEARGERPLSDGTGTDPDCEAGSVNLARLLAGSEGTLAVVTEATVSLEPLPETKAVALLTYEDVFDAAADVAPILDHDPAAVELIDDVLIDLALDTAEFHDVAASLPDGTRAALLVEFYADSDADGRRKVADLLTARAPSVTPEATPSSGVGVADDARAFDALEAHDEAARAGLWEMRKAAAPILLSRTTDEKHISFIEDCAVPADELPGYVERFREVIDDHDANTSFYAHAGPGVLHVRPLVNTKTLDGLDSFETIADEVTDFVVEAGGSVSGEHGDGRARTQWNRKLYGDRLWNAFRDLKTAFDPDWLLNPGQVCGDVSMTENLRFSPDYEFDAGFDPELEWDTENGFQGMAELCHGCGGCRGDQSTTGGVMCPTYRATEEEGLSTRGRANMLRQAMSGDLDADATDTEFMREVLDLCVGCKGCARDCPSEVDMAKLKAEVEHAHHQREGASLRDHLFAEVDRLNELGSRLAPLSNWAAKVPGARTVMEKTVGIARERSLPTFHRESLEDWFEARGGARVPEAEATDKVLLFPDSYTNYNHPDAGKAAVRVLEAAGVHVSIPDDVTATGRPAHSKGFLDRSRARAETNVDALAPRVESGWSVVLVEPSDAVMLQSDYLDLLSSEDAEHVAAETYGIMEYLDAKRLVEDLDCDASAGAADETLTYHGHCHQKATRKDHHAVGVLRRAGYDVDPLDSGCCGMAGSFGYEAEHHSLSTAIGGILADQISGSRGDTVVAPGASCRTQLEDMDGAADDPPHPIEKVSEAVAD